MALASALGVRGTPAFVIGKQFVPGAVDAAALKQLIADARKGQGCHRSARRTGRALPAHERARGRDPPSASTSSRLQAQPLTRSAPGFSRYSQPVEADRRLGLGLDDERAALLDEARDGVEELGHRLGDQHA